MLRELCRSRWLLSSLLVAGAALFGVGVAAERHATAHHTETSAVTASTGESGTGESGTGESGTESSEMHTEQPATDTAGHSESANETVLGVNLESTALVVFAAAVSLVLAAVTFRRDIRSVLLATVGCALVFAAFDIAEVAHQIKESRAGLAMLAAVVAVVHVATGLVAADRARAVSESAVSESAVSESATSANAE
jgi:FtsH-binding integral membrane protein